jgi:hypothetical protein
MTHNYFTRHYVYFFPFYFSEIMMRLPYYERLKIWRKRIFFVSL